MLHEPDLEDLEREKIEDARQNRRMLTVLVLAILTVVGVLGLTVFRFEDSATLKAQRDTQERADCVRRINDERTVIRDERDNLSSQVLVAALTPPFDSTKVAALNTQLTEKVNELKTLPPLQKQVDKACPSV
jgi:hypothetical protein